MMKSYLMFVDVTVCFAWLQGMPSSCGSSDGRNFPHMSLDFLQPDKVRDAEKRTREDPDYDPRTLYIPESFLSKQTPVRLIKLLAVPDDVLPSELPLLRKQL